MNVNELIKTGTLVGGVIGGWLFATTYFATAEAMEAQSKKLNETMTYIQIDIAEDRLYRLRLQGVETNEQKAKEKQLEKRIERLDDQLEKEHALPR